MVATIEMMMDFTLYLVLIAMLLTAAIVFNKASEETIKKTMAFSESQRDVRIIDSFLLTGKKGTGMLISIGNKSIKVVGENIFISYKGREVKVTTVAKGWDVEAM